MLKKIIQNFIRIMQKVLITISLITVYIVGIGVTFVFAVIFKRQILKEKYRAKNTFWNEAKDYEADFNSSLRQS